jgi:hypothetical protein
VKKPGREPDGGLGGPIGILKPGPAPDSAGGDSIRLRAENEKLKKEVEKLKKEVEEAEARVAKLEGGSAPAAEPAKPAVKKGDWKTRRDSELEAKVKSMAWRKNVKSLIDYWKEIEKSRAEGRAPRIDPDMGAQLAQLTADAKELHTFLGIESKSIWDAMKNKVVGEAWMDATLQELAGGTLTDAQLARLRATKLYDGDEPEGLDDNSFEAWKYLLLHNQSYTTETAGVLSAEQLAQVAKGASPTFMMSIYAQYSERTVSGAAGVTDYWLDSFKLAADQRAAVEAVAGDFAARLAELNQSYVSRYGASVPRDADFEWRLKALDLQKTAEKQLVETLALDAEQSKKLLKGSGSVIKLAN